MLDGNSSALRQHEDDTCRAERVQNRADDLAEAAALDTLCDPDLLCDFIRREQPEIWLDLSNLLNPETSEERVEHYRRELQRMLLNAIKADATDACLEQAWNEDIHGTEDV